MAAVNVAMKLSKQDRRVLAKQLKSQKTVFRHEKITCSTTPTKHLVVANGGLGNDIEYEELWTIFSPFGQIVDIVMKPRKPFAFVSFSSDQEAVNAIAGVHGRVLRYPEELSRPNVVFYLSFVEQIPDAPLHPDHGLLPPGLVLIQDFISEEYEQLLLSTIDWNQAVDGSLKHRQVKHYGYRFMYETNNVDRDHPLSEKIPEPCSTLLDELAQRNLISRIPDQLTVNLYQPGQGIPPHTDTHSAFEDDIIILSLGSQIVMDFCHPDGRHIPVVLNRRSVAIMSGESRYLWTHGITPRKSDIVPIAASTETEQLRLTLMKRGIRTSFTFRSVRWMPCSCNYPTQCDSQKQTSSDKDADSKSSLSPVLPKSDKEASELESQHVHQVYEEIAHHFSSTRHTPWPRVVAFLEQLPTNALVADVGCGNGKYLDAVSDRFMIGCDRSFNLCSICRAKGCSVIVCDGLSLPFRDGVFDAVICIAVIHHLSTQERRVRAVEEIARILSPGGRALVYVWAMEQEKDGVKSKYLKDNSTHPLPDVENGSDDSVIRNDTVSDSVGNECGSSGTKMPVHTNRTAFQSPDVLVPWHARGEKHGSKSKREKQADPDVSNIIKSASQVHLEDDLPKEHNCSPSHESVQSTIASNGKENPDDILVNGMHKKETDRRGKSEGPNETFHRYYHVFQNGELEHMCSAVQSISVVKSYYDQGNWCVIFERK